MGQDKIKKLDLCRICGNKKLTKILPLGSTPLANSFLTKEELDRPEAYYPLELNFCNRCSHLQLGHVVEPDLLFRNYVYVSSTSPLFVAHFEKYAEDIYRKFRLGKQSLIVDIGSNDGVLLKPFKKLGTKVLGIDPAVNIAKKATKEGLETIPEYFTPELATQLKDKYGQAAVITANNVFAHVFDLDGLITAVKTMLAPDGAFIIEVPYLADFITKNLFDTVYHEHLSYYSVKPLTLFFKKLDMRVFDVQKVDSHGGSIRVFVKNKKGRHKVKRSVKKLIAEEKTLGLYNSKTFKDFGGRISQNKIELTKFIHDLKAKGKKVVGYGAPAKGNTLLNYFAIGADLVDYIVDDNPLKQGLYTPGTHIPIVPASRLRTDRPDYILVLAWNFARPIMEKLVGFKKQGVGFILPAPNPTVIEGKKSEAEGIVEEDIQNIITGLGHETRKLEGKTLLISGGSGFLGSYIIQAIHHLNNTVLKKKCKVISIDNYITGSKRGNFLGDINDENIEFIFHDVRLPILIRDEVDYIVHAAGLASPFYYQKYPLETIESAVVGAKNLLELARSKKAQGFLFFSSSEIYGNPDPRFVPIPEGYAGNVSSVGPRACYDESKRLGETLCLVYHQQFGVPIKIVRPFNVYGPGMKIKDYRVIPTFLYQGLTGRLLPVHGSGQQTRTFCYVTDAIIGCLKVLLLGKPGEIYNVGSEKPEIGMLDLAHRIAKIINNGVKVKLVNYPNSYPAGEPQRRCPDLTKIRTELNYKPQVELDTGLKRSLIWFKSAYNL